MNPIIQRELVGLVRTRRVIVMVSAAAALLALFVIVRWPTDARADLSGLRSRQIFTVASYGLLALLTLMVPSFPATALVRERQRGTLALLLNSPMHPVQIYAGKLLGVLGLVALLLIVSLPAAAACYAMGGLALFGDIGSVYLVLIVCCLEYSTFALFISTVARSADSALRLTYGGVLVLSVITLVPYYFLQGFPGVLSTIAGILRMVSPIPAVMELAGHQNLGTQGLIQAGGAPIWFLAITAVLTALFVALTIRRLNHAILDRARSQGAITDEQTRGVRIFRRLMFLVDPQRRKAGILLLNPVMVKEFRTRQFGRFHWLLRIVAACALISLTLCYVTAIGTVDWGVETIGAIIVTLQVALILLFTPTLAAGLISGEIESGGWDLLRTTPLSAGRILRGKLLSVLLTLAFILCATLPGYWVMHLIKPILVVQVRQVLVCLVLTALFSVLLSATVSSFFRKSAAATATSYALLMLICVGTLLVWLGRDAPFGHSTVEAVLSINPMAAAFSVMGTTGFAQYDLVPVNWWIIGCSSLVLLIVLLTQTWRLTRPL